MNIENNKIPGRQFGRIIFYDFFALSTLVLPGKLAEAVGMVEVFVLAVGGAAGYLLLLLVLSQICRMRQDGQDYERYLRGYFGKWLTGAIVLIYGLTALFGAAYGLCRLCDISRQYLLRDTPPWLVLAVLTLLGVYGICGEQENRGRMYELLFWFVVFPLFFLIVLAARNVSPERWVPVFCAERTQVLKQSYIVFAFFMGSVFLPVHAESVTWQTDVARVSKQSYVFGVCMSVVLFLILAGIFGVPTVATMKEAVLVLTGMVKVPGGFLERQDALLCGIWLVSIYAFAENALYALAWSAKKVCGTHVRRWISLAVGVVVYVLAVCMYHSRQLTAQLSRCYLRWAVPILTGIVLVLCILSVWQDRQHPDLKMPREEDYR